MSDALDDPLVDLLSAKCSNGAPSARNLLVTVFGDALLPHGDDTAASVRSLATLLASFGVNERLVRTSLTRLVNEGLLVTRKDGRRSYYRVAPDALELFSQADRRIYGAPHPDWDGSWTIVVVDGTESTAARRATLRQELAWAGLGVVAPNVMASPVVTPEEAVGAVARVGGFSNVLVSRSRVVEGNGTLGADELARRCADLGDIAEMYAGFVERFERFDERVIGDLGPGEAFKLRTLLIGSYRRIVLEDPLLPDELLAEDWVGRRARRVAARIYGSVAPASEAFLASSFEPPLKARAASSLERFTA